MQFIYWLIFLVAIAIAILAVQNSNAPLVMIKFLIWRFETSLTYTILGAIGLGILVTLFLWIPRAIKSSIRLRALKKQVEHTETALHPNLRSKKTTLNNHEKSDHHPCICPNPIRRNTLFREIKARKENHRKPQDFERIEH